MKTLTLLIFGFLLFPMSLSAQSADVLLQKVSEALSAGKDDYAVSLLRQAAGAGTGQAEMYHWTNVEKNSAVAPRFVRELAIYYKDKRNYDKAYLFHKEWLQHNPEDVSGFVAYAEMQMIRGETKDALRLYKKVLTLDADSLQANTSLDNYYYLQAGQKEKILEENHKKIVSPTRMQYVHYRSELSDVFSNGYGKAKGYLQKVLQLFPSTEAGRMSDKIKKMELELK